jgi:predicted Zn-dependent protease
VSQLTARGETKEAEELCLKHARSQPNNQANHLRAAQILETRGQPGEAAQALQAAVRSGPATLPVHLRLGNLLYREGRRDEALDQLATAWRLSRDEGDAETADTIRRLIARIRSEQTR